MESCCFCGIIRVKRLPTMQETQVRSLGREDPWKKKWPATPVFLLENPMDRGAWPATVREITKSLTQLSSFTLTFHGALQR